MSTLLGLENVSCSFGQVQALRGVSTEVEEGEVRGLIGPNGAGKTTLVNVLSGFLGVSAGAIEFAGERIDTLPAHARVRVGIGRTFQTPQLCTGMSVLDNVVVGAHQRLASARLRNLVGGRRTSLGTLRREAAELASSLGLDELLGVPAGALSYGHMRLLEIARALIARPKLLLLDEPVAGMNETESDGVAQLVRALPGRGTSVLLIEHDMPFVMGLCDRITVLDHGVVIAEGTPETIQQDPAVEEVYLGTLGDAA
ncbi:MAG TPA: ABC transporter ATP-binding protein [Gaiellaceae bacterium]|nr:ABC transporter ATP-binding protein [Gaiellaceae bacterium]